jgi:hypothetical protein
VQRLTEEGSTLALELAIATYYWTNGHGN